VSANQFTPPWLAYVNDVPVVAVDGAPPDIILVGAFIVTNTLTSRLLSELVATDPFTPAILGVLSATQRLRDALGFDGVPLVEKVDVLGRSRG
jgi:hypothetical protein